jgi:hypothetical protein
MLIAKNRLKQIIKEEMHTMNVGAAGEFENIPQGYDDTVEGQDQELDYEGYMTKSQLFKIGEYALKIHDMIEDGENLPEWMQSKVAQMDQMIGSVYHALNYDNIRGVSDEHDYQQE